MSCPTTENACSLKAAFAGSRFHIYDRPKAQEHVDSGRILGPRFKCQRRRAYSRVISLNINAILSWYWNLNSLLVQLSWIITRVGDELTPWSGPRTFPQVSRYSSRYLDWQMASSDCISVRQLVYLYVSVLFDSVHFLEDKRTRGQHIKVSLLSGLLCLPATQKLSQSRYFSFFVIQTAAGLKTHPCRMLRWLRTFSLIAAASSTASYFSVISSSLAVKILLLLGNERGLLAWSRSCGATFHFDGNRDASVFVLQPLPKEALLL